MFEYVKYNSYLLESDKITEAANKMKLESSLKDISSMLYRHFGSEVVILIDVCIGLWLILGATINILNKE